MRKVACARLSARLSRGRRSRGVRAQGAFEINLKEYSRLTGYAWGGTRRHDARELCARCTRLQASFVVTTGLFRALLPRPSNAPAPCAHRGATPCSLCGRGRPRLPHGAGPRRGQASKPGRARVRRGRRTSRGRRCERCDVRAPRASAWPLASSWSSRDNCCVASPFWRAPAQRLVSVCLHLGMYARVPRDNRSARLRCSGEGAKGGLPQEKR